jgi:hypothetical protein
MRGWALLFLLCAFRPHLPLGVILSLGIGAGAFVQPLFVAVFPVHAFMPCAFVQLSVGAFVQHDINEGAFVLPEALPVDISL